MADFSWRGKTVLVTSGPTREHLDPIRFLTNASSGRMGFALAARARKLGARAIVVSGPSALIPPAKVKTIFVTTGLEMYRRVMALRARADVVIGAAAVSDWRFERRAPRKLKRGPGTLRLTMLPNPDIIKAVARRRVPGRRQVVVGFALETHDSLSHARRKLMDKGLDAVVVNGPGALAGSKAQAVFLRRDGGARPLRLAAKSALAAEILKEVESLW